MFTIEVFPQVIALLPMATYFLLLGGLRLMRKPVVTTGVRDGAAVAIALSGVIMIGPAYLFFPSLAAAELGWYVWIVLGLFYALCVSLALMSMRPRIVIYGLRSDEALPHLHRAAQTVDPEAVLETARRQVVLPERGVTLRVDGLGITDAVQVETFERNLHPRFWRHMLLELRRSTAATRTPPSIGGAGMLFVGVLLLVFAVGQAMGQPGEMLAGFRQWLRG